MFDPEKLAQKLLQRIIKEHAAEPYEDNGAMQLDLQGWVSENIDSWPPEDGHKGDLPSHNELLQKLEGARALCQTLEEILDNRNGIKDLYIWDRNDDCDTCCEGVEEFSARLLLFPLRCYYSAVTAMMAEYVVCLFEETGGRFVEEAAS